MENYFKISELCIDKNKEVPQDIADKVLLYHIVPMNKVRQELDEAIFCSQKSGWRPKEWELSRGRSGNSEHTFIKKGAVDWTIGGVDKHEVDGNFEGLFKMILEHTNYTRIAVYPSARFIHCDYASTYRKLFLSTNASKWTEATEDKILSKI